MKSLRKAFVEGLLLFLPVFLTFYVLYLLLRFTYRLMDFGVLLLPEQYRGNVLLTVPIVIATVVLTVSAVAFVGMTAKTLFGRLFQRYTDSLMESIPFVKSVYSSLKQFFLVLSGGSGRIFARPALVPFPFAGRTSIGFVTGECAQRRADGTVGQCYLVFVPTVPNPTTGFTIMYNKEDVVFPAMSAEQALRLILSGGILHQR